MLVRCSVFSTAWRAEPVPAFQRAVASGWSSTPDPPHLSWAGKELSHFTKCTTLSQQTAREENQHECLNTQLVELHFESYCMGDFMYRMYIFIFIFPLLFDTIFISARKHTHASFPNRLAGLFRLVKVISTLFVGCDPPLRGGRFRERQEHEAAETDVTGK